MITLNVGGTEFDNFVSAEVHRSMLEFNNEASFVIAIERGDDIPFVGNEPCEVLVDSKKVMTGFIDSVSVNYTKSSHEISYIVRDKTADFADSQIDVINDLAGSLDLHDIIHFVLDHLGLNTGRDRIRVLDKASPNLPFDIANDNLIPEVGENCFDYCQKLALKRQVLLVTNADGDIEIIRNSGVKYETSVQNVFSNIDDNNVLSGQYTYSTLNSFRKYIVKSQLSSASSGSSFDSPSSSEKIVNQNGVFEDKGVRKGRQKVIISGESSSDKDNAAQAKWQANYEISKSTIYSISFLGHSIHGELWEPNKLIQIVDDFAEINRIMLVESVDHTFNVSRGSLSSIKFTDKESFSLIVTDPAKKEKTSSNDNTLSL